MIYYCIKDRVVFKFEKVDWIFTTGLALLIAALILSLCSCVSIPQAGRPKVARVHALAWQKGDKGFYYSTADKNYIVLRGVPSEWFTQTPRGWYIDELSENRAADILSEGRNP